MTTAPPQQGDEIGRWGWLLLAVWVAPPLLWLLQLQATYAYAAFSCEAPHVIAIVGALAATTVLVGGLAAIAWVARRRASGAPPAASPAAASFVAVVGLFLSLQLVMVMLAQALAVAILSPCS